MFSKRLLYTFFCLFVCYHVIGQDFSNKGTEFWVGYGYHQVMTNGLSTQNAQDMLLYFTSDQAAKVTVEIPSVGWVRTYNIAANKVTESDAIPKTGAQDARLLVEGTYNTGIHITSDNPIVAYAHIYDRSVSGASLLFPVSTLGQDYYSVNFTQRSNQPNSNSWVYVVAAEDNTLVEITPSANTVSHSARQPFTVSLNKGQIYNLMGTTNENNGEDLTGTRIRSISTGNSTCKKIAVFSGSGRLSINCDNSVTTSDNTIQQVFPRNAWGRKYLTVPTARLTNNYFRIIVSDPSTVVSIDGAPAGNLRNNFFYEIAANSPKSIVADKPIMVAQFITSTDDGQTPTCGNSFNSNGDPEMIYLSPIEQTIDKITLNSTNHYQITSHYINVIIKSSAVNSFSIDGAPSTAAFIAHPRDGSYSYAVLNVAQGSHTLKADSGFNAIAYGYGGTESYGYNAGTNVKDLYQFITLRNQHATVRFPLTCKDTKFYFSISLPYKASALVWDFGANAHISPNQTVTQNSPAPDSSYSIDGKVLYVYSLPSLYSYDQIGTYPLKITANNQTSDGCNGLAEISYDVQVVDLPVTDFTFGGSGCLADSVNFKDVSDGRGRLLQKWKWDFGDGTIDSVANPYKVFPGPRQYIIKETSINDIGCASETTKPVTIGAKPNASFTFSKETCEKSPLTFTDQSTIASGKITKWGWNFGDGTSENLLSGNPFQKRYNTSGNYTVSLVVTTDVGCTSDTVRHNISIGTSPVSNFILPRVCVNDLFASFTDSSYTPGSGATNLAYLWNFGDPNANATNPNTANTANPQHKYSKAGIYNVSLTVSSNSGCSTTSTKSLTVNGGSPLADFSINDSGVICSSATVTLKNNSTVDIGSIQRLVIYWDSGNSSSVQSDDSPYLGKVYSHKFPVAPNVKTYLVRMVAFSGTNCFGEKIIPVTVNPSPAITISPLPPICLNDSPRSITEVKETSGMTGTFSFQGNGISQSGLFNPVQAGAGTTSLKFVFTSTSGCRDSASQTIEVIPNPVVEFVSPVYVLEGGSVSLNPSVQGNVIRYQWTPGTYLNNPSIKNPVCIPGDSITYLLSATTQGGCTGNGKVSVIIMKSLSIPNAFSPNGDGINDQWIIPSLQNYINCRVEVFNRYGKPVFESNGYSRPWDGTVNGNALPVGTYYYVIDAKNGNKPYTGYVSIIK